MTARTPIAVLKLGGGLEADPARRRALIAAVADGAHGPCVVVPGGGAEADAVRAAQGLEGFDDAEAHRRALDAMGRQAARLVAIEPRLVLSLAPWSPAPSPPPSAGEGIPQSGGGVGSADAGSGDRRAGPCTGVPRSRPPLTPRAPAGPPSPAEGGETPVCRVWDPALLRPGHPDIPETWDVTSDSLSLWLAARLGAGLCALVKAADAHPLEDAAALAARGYVDEAFPAFAARFPGRIELWGPAGPVALTRRAAA